jgi:hypothetical protein
MSQQGVERTIGKLCTDADFRSRFFANPEAAAHGAGLLLSPAELQALTALSPEAVVRFAQAIDPRITRLCPEKHADGHCPR